MSKFLEETSSLSHSIAQILGANPQKQALFPRTIPNQLLKKLAELWQVSPAKVLYKDFCLLT